MEEKLQNTSATKEVITSQALSGDTNNANNNSNKGSKNILALGLVSFFNDVASETIYPLVPIFLTTILGASVLWLLQLILLLGGFE